MKKLDIAALALLIVGGLNWGLVGIAKFDLVAAVAGLEFGETNWFSRLVYCLVLEYAFQRWLAADNFDARGEQRTTAHAH